MTKHTSFNSLAVLCESSMTRPAKEFKQDMIDYLKSLDIDSKHQVVSLLLIGNTGSDLKDLKLGPSLIRAAVLEATDTLESVKTKRSKVKDFSSHAMDHTLKRTCKARLVDIYTGFKAIAALTGKGSTNFKKEKMIDMYSTCSPVSARWLTRFFEAKPRIGLSEKNMLDILSKVYNLGLRQDIALVKQTFNTRPDMKLLLLDLEKGISALKNVGVVPGVNVKSMLASPSSGLEEIFKRFKDSDIWVDCKYDGERVQVHNKDGDFQLYSRNCECTTSKYPDIISGLEDYKDTNFILDCEIVAFDYEKNTFLPFQVLQSRKNKDVVLDSVTIPVKLVVFDMLFLDTRDYTGLPLHARISAGKAFFKELEFAMSMDPGLEQEQEQVKAFFESCVNQHACEGIMVKNKESKYIPGKRSLDWLKLKKDYIDTTMSDSLDLYVIGADYGKGKREKVFGSFLMGTLDRNDNMLTVCKIGTGLSDEFLDQIFLDLKSKIGQTQIPIPGSDVTFKRPYQLWEIKSAELTKSEKYTSGYSLRFPRLVRVRTDKDECTRVQELEAMYSSQG